MIDEMEARGSDPTAASPETAGVAMAFGAASRHEADAYLRKQQILADEQVMLVRLQAHELKDELKLRHWSKRVHHVSDVMKLAFEFSLAVILLGVVALIGSAVWNAAHDHGAVVEAFSVPPDLAAKGLTGEVVAAKILDRLTDMQAQTSSARAVSSYSRNWGDNIKVQIPDTGISIGEFNRYLHEWLGNETRITGQVYRTEKGLAVSARASGTATPVFEGQERDLNGLIDKAAKGVYGITQPYRYAIYLWTHDKAVRPVWTADDTEADAIMNQLIHTGSIEDRVWAYDGIGMHKRSFGDFYGAVAWIRKSIAVEPGLDAYGDLGDSEAILQHGEEELSARLATHAFATRGADTDTDPLAAEEIALSNRVGLALLRGDAPTALEDLDRLHAVAGGAADSPKYDYFADLTACGLLHDSACVSAIEEAHPVPAEYRRVADILLRHFPAAARETKGAHALFLSLREFGAALALRYEVPESALVAANLGDFASAFALIAKTPLDCDQCLQFRGRIDALTHNWRGAAYWFARAVQTAPSLPYPYCDWGEMLLHKGDFDGAIAKFEQAHAKGPHFADPLEMWGEALIAKNHSDLALAKFEEANKYAPKWGRLHLKWGEALMYLGRLNDAKKQFAAAARLDLSDSDRQTLAVAWRR